jgi:hypothetical protein
MITHTCTNIYIYIHTYSDGENKIMLMGPPEGTVGDRIGKENVGE